MYSKTYKVDEKSFRYNYDNHTIEWFADSDDFFEGELITEKGEVFNEVGLSVENWEDNPQYWCEVFNNEIEEEMQYLF